MSFRGILLLSETWLVYSTPILLAAFYKTLWMHSPLENMKSLGALAEVYSPLSLTLQQIIHTTVEVDVQ